MPDARSIPDALFAYANYPSTEYLNPDNADFIAYNVYLEDRSSFEKYLARLQNIAGDKPLLISEFGIDSLNHGANDQAEIIAWHLDSAIGCGVAGTTIFAYTDDWLSRRPPRRRLGLRPSRSRSHQEARLRSRPRKIRSRKFAKPHSSADRNS